MGVTKKEYERLFSNCEGIIVHDEYGNPRIHEGFEEIGSFEEYTVFRRKHDTNKKESDNIINNNKNGDS